MTRHTFIRAALLASNLAILPALAAPARALEIIPAIGMSGGDTGGTAQYYALDVRLPVVPTLNLDGGVAFRSRDYSADIKATQWTVNGSLLWQPVPFLYAGAGLGSYTTDFTQPINASYDTNDTRLASHLTAGYRLPIVPKVATLDVNGRYVFLGQKVPTATDGSLKANFWLLSAGLSIGF